MKPHIRPSRVFPGYICTNLNKFGGVEKFGRGDTPAEAYRAWEQCSRPVSDERQAVIELKQKGG